MTVNYNGRGGYDLTVVIPVFNEEETLGELRDRLKTVLQDLEIEYEVILVDDGSTDESLDILKRFASDDPRFKVLTFSRNFGHQAALYAGLCQSRGDAVVLMDADLQDPPEVIPRLLERWRSGFEVVFAVRTKRKEGYAKRLAYMAYYRLLRSMAYMDIPLDTGDFSLMDRRVADELGKMPERNKFLRGLRTWVGFRQTKIVYERDARFAGEPKYTLSKLLKLGLDGMISYSYVPLRMASILGAIVAGFSFLLAAAYLAQRLFVETYVPQGFTTLAILILFIGGIQMLTVGLIGEYIGKIYDEVKRRPEYIVRERTGFGNEPGQGSLGVPASVVDRLPDSPILPH